MIGALSLGLASTVFAGNMRDNVGCGLGTTLLGEQQDSVLMEVLATTTNRISGKQTFVSVLEH